VDTDTLTNTYTLILRQGCVAVTADPKDANGYLLWHRENKEGWISDRRCTRAELPSLLESILWINKTECA
jgi:hypothetical protein